MYRYEYVPLSIGEGSWNDNPDNAHRVIIARYAQNGWRYVGYMPTAFTIRGIVKKVDMIFEKEEG